MAGRCGSGFGGISWARKDWHNHVADIELFIWSANSKVWFCPNQILRLKSGEMLTCATDGLRKICVVRAILAMERMARTARTGKLCRPSDRRTGWFGESAGVVWSLYQEAWPSGSTQGMDGACSYASYALGTGETVDTGDRLWRHGLVSGQHPPKMPPPQHLLLGFPRAFFCCRFQCIVSVGWIFLAIFKPIGLCLRQARPGVPQDCHGCSVFRIVLLISFDLRLIPSFHLKLHDFVVFCCLILTFLSYFPHFLHRISNFWRTLLQIRSFPTLIPEIVRP